MIQGEPKEEDEGPKAKRRVVGVRGGYILLGFSRAFAHSLVWTTGTTSDTRRGPAADVSRHFVANINQLPPATLPSLHPICCLFLTHHQYITDSGLIT